MYSLTKCSSLLSEDRTGQTPLKSTIKHRMYSRLDAMKTMLAMEFLSGMQVTGLNITRFPHLQLIGTGPLPTRADEAARAVRRREAAPARGGEQSF
jgi:hypothetical protein